MIVEQSKVRNTIWQIGIESREEAQAPIAAKLAAFTEHKNEILKKLREGYDRGSKSKPFDEENSWVDLTASVELYLWRKIAKRETTPLAERFNRLRRLAKALRLAHGLANQAMQEDIGGDLFKAWFAKTKIPLTSATCIYNDGSSVISIVADEIKNAVAALATLENVALTAAAANAVPPNAGRPALLPSDFIQGLARVYRNRTESKPGRGEGPFASFALEFFTAANPDCEIKYDSVIGAIKNAHHRHKPSMFDD